MLENPRLAIRAPFGSLSLYIARVPTRFSIGLNIPKVIVVLPYKIKIKPSRIRLGTVMLMGKQSLLARTILVREASKLGF